MVNIKMMISEEQKKELSSLIADIVPDKHYWFFRTMGGELYGEFCNEGFVALGYNEILSNTLADAPVSESAAREYIKQRLFNTGQYDSKVHVAKAAGQILKFYRAMDKGDYVVIPSRESTEFAIGIVQGDMYEDNGNHPEGTCQFNKRRKVKWIRKVRRIDLDSNFLLGLSNQQTMSSINKYAGYIDRKLDSLYSKDGITYLVLRVNQDKGLSWNDFCVISDLAELLQTVTEDLGEEVDTTQIEMKINVQSPGDILLACPDVNNYLLALLGMIISIIIAGGEIKFLGIKFKANGIGELAKTLVDVYNKYKDGKTERKLKEVQIRLQNLKLDKITDDDLAVSGSLKARPSDASPALTEDGNVQRGAQEQKQQPTQQPEQPK